MLNVVTWFVEMIPTIVTIGLGLVSMMIATNLRVGLLTLIFHFWCLQSFVELMRMPSLHHQDVAEIFGFLVYREFPGRLMVVVAIVSWTVAWALQVGVGHWMWEQNQPNVVDQNRMGSAVSYLAVTTSVLIAWSSY